MHDEHKIEKLCEIKDTLLDWLTREVGKGKDDFDPLGASKTTDMIKDLSETIEKCTKAKYYNYLMCTMVDQNKEDPEERYGYDNYRYANGRFAPSGHGHRSGYSVDVRTPNYHGDYKMGYPMHYEDNSSKYGAVYDQYRDAKKHYTETRSTESRDMMDRHIDEKVMETADIMWEMYEDASPENKRKMVTNLTKLLEKMK